MRYLVPGFLCCAALCAQVVPSSAPSIRPDDKCSLEGIVVNAVTGEPLKKVHLTLRPLGVQNGVPYGTTTDSAGHFLINDVDPGRYNFSASRNGFVGQPYSPQGSTNRNAPLTLSNGQQLKEIVFKLTPQGVISGRILDEDGDPLSGVAVQCMVYSYQGGKRQLMNRNGGSTNDLGEFRLFGGEYKVYAWEDIEPGAQQDPDFVKPHESAGEAVSVKESSHETVQLKVVAAENSAGQRASQ